MRTVHKTVAHFTKYSSSAVNLSENGSDCSFCRIDFIAISLKVYIFLLEKLGSMQLFHNYDILSLVHTVAATAILGPKMRCHVNTSI